MENIVFVGVDLHKTQFTTCTYVNENMLEKGTKYKLNNEGYNSFLTFVRSLKGKVVKIALESTANARDFKDRMENNGFVVTVVNTLRFKVVNQSTRKTDKNDAHTLVSFLMKDLLPKSNLCSFYCETIIRLLKCRALLVQDCVSIKNQCHALMLACGQQTSKAQFQSKKKRNEILNNL
ncbi:MAG: transposase, partial [Sphaerochaetaceae bacterium]|nr:transposase [Sphaerochaetaceae bacterium]